MKTKLLDLKKYPTIHVLNIETKEFISCYKKFMKDKRFTLLPADDGSGKVGLIAYYEDAKKREVGYYLKSSWPKVNKFLRNLKNNKWYNIHHYCGLIDPKKQLDEQHKKRAKILLDELFKIYQLNLKVKKYICQRLKNKIIK